MRRGRLAALLLVPLFLFGCASTGDGPRLIASRPDRPPISASAVRAELAAALERDDRRAVTLGMMNLARMGAGLSAQSQARLTPLLDESALPKDWRPSKPLAQAFADNFEENAGAKGESELFAMVPAEHRIIEGIAWDAATGRLFVGSVIDRRLLALEGETWRVVPTAGPIGGVFGMAVDPKRRLLWFASSAAEPMERPEGAFAGLIAIDLDRLEEVRRVPVPDSRLGDVALARDGTLFASDGRSGAIYRCRPGCTAAELLIPPGLLKSPQGMVAWSSGTLYVADYASGLYRVDLGSLRITPIRTRFPEMLDGIDGLLRSGDHLVAVQNGTRPNRIIALWIERRPRIVHHVDILEQAQPHWGEPTLAALDGARIIYVADGQWERFGRGDAVRDGGALRPTAIRVVTFGGDIIVSRDGKMPVREALLSLATPRPGS